MVARVRTLQREQIWAEQDLGIHVVRLPTHGDNPAHDHVFHEIVYVEAGGAEGLHAGRAEHRIDLLDDPHLKKRGAFVTVDHPVRGEFTIPGCPIKMSGSPVEVKAAPLLGADNNEIYGKLLGLPADDLAALQEQKII